MVSSLENEINLKQHTHTKPTAQELFSTIVLCWKQRACFVQGNQWSFLLKVSFMAQLKEHIGFFYLSLRLTMPKSSNLEINNLAPLFLSPFVVLLAFIAR